MTWLFALSCTVFVAYVLLLIFKPFMPYELLLSNVRANAFVAIISPLSIWLVAVCSMFLWPKLRKYKIHIFGLCAFSLLPWLLACLLYSEALTTNKDLGYEKLGQIAISPNRFISFYRTNGGATTDFGVQVAEEREFLGFTLRRYLADEYHCWQASGKILDAHTVEVSFERTGSRTEPLSVQTLRF